MKCFNHHNIDAVGTCVSCGRGVCVECKTMLGGRIYCKPCADQAYAQRLATMSTISPATRVVVSGQRAKGAVASLICSIIGLFFFQMILGPVAISLASGARRRIQENPRLEGGGIAAAGLMIGIIDSVIFGVVILMIMITCWAAL